MSDTTHPRQREDQAVQIIYILYLVGIAVGLTALVGIVWAYIARGNTQPDDWERSHLTYQIRTFWIGLLYSLIGVVTAFVLIGFLILLAGAIWYIVRCVKGLMAHGQRQPIENPGTWLW